jgi:hypothetical protein
VDGSGAGAIVTDVLKSLLAVSNTSSATLWFRVRRFCEAYQGSYALRIRFRVHYTPTHGSWLKSGGDRVSRCISARSQAPVVLVEQSEFDELVKIRRVAVGTAIANRPPHSPLYVVTAGSQRLDLLLTIPGFVVFGSFVNVLAGEFSVGCEKLAVEAAFL